MNTLEIYRFIRSYLEYYQNYKTYWNYEDGCVLSGCGLLYEVTGDRLYKDFIVRYMDEFIEADGRVSTYEKEKYSLDSINSGKALFFLYDETKEERYRIAIETVYSQLETHPRTKCGNFWHKMIYPDQIWLDGLYMAMPFYMAYEVRYHNAEHCKDIVEQFQNVRKYLFDCSKKLYCHAFDEARKQKWADKATGRSPNYWLRSMGWYLMALVDTLEELPTGNMEHKEALTAIFQEAVEGILKYQDEESKLFFQLIDKADTRGNYTETSGTAMIAYSLMKACTLGILEKEKYLDTGREMFEELAVQKLIMKDGSPHLSDICSVAGLGPGDARDGSVAYYLSEKVVWDDPKGVGAFMMAYSQWLSMLHQRCGKGGMNGEEE